VSSNSWDRIREILNAYYDQQPADRSAWLRGRCEGDEDLRREVESLLDADEAGFVSDEEWLMGSLPSGEFHAGDTPTSSTEPDSDAQVLGQVGPYRLVEEIGAGGMSTVYRAERADGAFERAVAVKLLRRRFQGENAEERFRAERQVLASLQHPNIAQLIDGGVTEKERPYLVMELVDGTPITEYVEKEALGLEARLELFRQVAEAVQTAHRQLVVHRDLKPSNVLVTEAEGSPQVKLLDFGIAKLLGDTLPVTRPETRTGQQPFTLAYASPEQVTGRDVSTQTDVYQLGVLAYEMLAGTRPFDFSDTYLAEKEQIITEETPPKPSEQATGRALAQIGEDLDTIVLKALRKEPGRRYSTVEALASDLRRFQEGRPVEARPASPWYRTKKFLQRNAIGTGVAAAFLALVVLSAVLLVQQRNQAQREARKAEAVSGYLIDLLQSARPDESAGDTVTAADMLRRGRERIDRLEGQPAVQARMLQLLGNAYRERAKYGKAARLLRRSLGIRDSLHGGAHKHVANTIEELAHLQQQRGQYQRADSLWRRALGSQRDLFGPGSPKLWEPLNNLGIAAIKRGDHAKADSLLQAALAAEQSAPAPDSGDLASTLQNLALASSGQGNRERADSLYRRALSIQRATTGPVSKGVAVILHNLASLLQAQGKLSQADSLYQRAISITQRVLGPQHPSTATSLLVRGGVLLEQERPARAMSLFRKARSIFRRKLPDNSTKLALTTERMGRALTDLGRYQKAKSLLKRCLKIYQERENESRIQEVRAELAELYDKWGKPKEMAALDTSATAPR